MFEDRITSDKAAEILGITKSALARLCSRGTLPYEWFGGRRVLKRSAVEALKNDPEYQRRTRKPSIQQLLDSGAIKRGSELK